MRCFIEKIINSFDNNPWKSAAILVFVTNFLLLADAELVLIVSLALIFIYLIMFSVSSFSAFSAQKKEERSGVYITILEDIIKKLGTLQEEMSRASTFVYSITTLLSTWTANSLFYRCVEIKKTKNFLVSFIPPILFDIMQFHKQQPTLNLDSVEDKTSFLVASLL